MAGILKTLALFACIAIATPALANPLATSSLKPLDDTVFDIAFARLPGQAAKFTSVIVEPLDVWYVSREPDAQRRAWLSSQFDEALKSTLTQHGFRIVSNASRDTLRIRPQIIDLRLQTVDERVAGIDSRYAFDLEPGRMTLVLALSDAATGELIAQIADLDDQPLTTAPDAAGEAVADWSVALASTLPALGVESRQPLTVAAR